MVVNVVCRNLNDDRVIPRFSRYLRDHLGWILTARPIEKADIYYLSFYFEEALFRGWPDRPTAAYFTHREENQPDKARLFDRIAGQVDLRIATAAMYAGPLAAYGPAVQIAPAVERETLTPSPSPNRRGGQLVAGFSGYTYSNGRKGEGLARALIASRPGRALEWRASGRGWPVKTQRYSWNEMPAFYQSLDILVVTATVEGVPMPPLEALACGVSVVIPRGVGLLDELPDTMGIHRYRRGDAADCARALDEARRLRPAVDREALRAVTEPYTVAAWCEGHRRAFERVFSKECDLEPKLSGTDEEIMATVRRAWPDVGTVLSWTGRHIPYIKRQIAPYQGAVLAYCAQHYNRLGGKFLEIGTALGYSACLMATAAPAASIVTLNPKNGEFEKAVENLKIRATVRVVKSTSQEFWKSSEVGAYDLIFVDGDHAYEVVMHDSQFFNRLREGGLILFHDYSPDSSARPSGGCFMALNALQAKYRPADVIIIGSGQVGMLGWIRQEGEVW